MTQPTGVFVRLPLDEAQIMKLYNPKKSGNENLLAIGTPVTGGDIPVITTLGTLRDPIPCVRQTDTQATIAALEAEVGRLQNVVGAARTSIATGNPMKAAYVLETALKGPEA